MNRDDDSNDEAAEVAVEEDEAACMGVSEQDLQRFQAAAHSEAQVQVSKDYISIFNCSNLTNPFIYMIEQIEAPNTNVLDSEVAAAMSQEI